MADESDFFNSSNVNLADNQADNDYRHFRLIYESEHGFCRVFTARRHGRTFIVKALRKTYLKAPLPHAALRKEFECSMMVDSPYVARTYDFLTLPDLGEAIVMEYCPGSTLAQLISSGTLLSKSDIDKIIFSLARGIDDIHSAGLIHRDIKPENIIWMPQTGTLKIIDLGFSDSEAFYLLHEAAGTLRYTPPEKANTAEWKAITPDTYNDLYALGILLSDLTSIAPLQQQKILKHLSEMLVTRNITSGTELESCHKSLTNRSISKRYLMMIFVAAALLLAGLEIFLLQGNHANNDKQVSTGSEATMQMPSANIQEAEGADSISMLQQIQKSPNDNQQDPEYSKQQTTGPTPEATNQEVEVEKQQRIFVAPTELIKDEYGVCMAEAKYAANFRRDEIDEYAVNATDKLITESIITLQSDAASSEARQEAYLLLTDNSILPQRAAETTLSKYPSANSRRILGLSRQRHKYRLSDIDLAHLRP